MESIIDKDLFKQVKESKKSYYEKHKKEYIDKVLLTIKAISGLKSYDDLINLVSGSFTYKYCNLEGNSKIFPSLNENKVFNLGWHIDHKYHQYIAKINSHARILTWDSFNASKINKAGLSGIIQGKYLIKLQNYIRDVCPNSFTMVSNKILATNKEVNLINKLFEKYDVKEPFYQIQGSWNYEEKTFVIDDGYRSFYGTGFGSFISYDVILFFCNFDKRLVNKSGIKLDIIKSNLRKKLEKEDLYVLSFLGNKLNDNSMYKLISEFNPN